MKNRKKKIGDIDIEKMLDDYWRVEFIRQLKLDVEAYKKLWKFIDDIK